MLILSNFHDYYDTASTYGIDKSIVYNRHTTKIQHIVPDREVINQNFYARFERVGGQEVQWKIVFFCGEVFPLLKIFNGYDRNERQYTFLYGEEKIDEFLALRREHDALNYTSTYFLQMHERRKKRKPDSYYSYRSRFQRTLQHFQQKSEHFFVEHRTPIILVDAAEIVLNPPLKSIEFFTQRDSFTAFQDIMNFLSGVLGQSENNDVAMSDALKIQQHGFDVKWSFRNPDPPKRKQKH